MIRTFAVVSVLLVAAGGNADMLDRVEHRYAENGDVRLHYAIAGPTDAPLAVFIHGFPDFWYS